MGAIDIFLCVFVGHFIAVQSVVREQDTRIPQHFPGFFDNIMPFPFKRHFDFPPYDTIFSSWRTRAPDFHMLAEFPPLIGLPQVEVFCDDSKLTLLVDKRSSDIMLTGEEIQLGNGCYSNRELPNQFVFTYGLDECGTTRVMQNGLAIFTNSLHVNLKPPSTGWQAPTTVHISCIPKRSYANPNYFVSTTLAENDMTLNIKAMNPSWTSTAESNIYKRGRVVNLQVSATARPEQQQLFIQSCFVSASPDPQTRPRHAVIMNKGCTAPVGSRHAVVEFVASNRVDVVNFVLNTSYLISELYIHCSVLLSDQGVTSSSKFCNYNVIQSRWEDLSGAAEVCECCSSKCKGKHLTEDAKAIVSTGPLVIVDKDVETSPGPAVSKLQETSSAPVTSSVQSDASDGAAAEIVSAASIPRSRLSSPPQGVVVVSQDPAARLTLWLPGQVQDTEYRENTGSESEDYLTVLVQASDTASNDLPELQPSTKDQESVLNTPTNKIEDQNFNFLTLVDGWIISPHLEKAAIADESERKTWFRRFGLSGTDATQEVDVPLLDDITINVLNQNDLHQMREDLAQRPKDAAVMLQEGKNDVRPVIRSKLEFSKGMDGSQTLSYEEEIVKQQEGEGVIRRVGMAGIKKGIQEPRQKGLRSTFLDLLRQMAKAE
ncbi:zona pellucida protein C [Dicentrarchus labrax]|uniref:zona pellucida protein C n=1 Tax=Dicentrarchus labrax TaxID=13489 RepID=UPI0021F6918D|nr:zona pellucida protein C [Dicentrarchus labrax]